MLVFQESGFKILIQLKLLAQKYHKVFMTVVWVFQSEKKYKFSALNIFEVKTFDIRKKKKKGKKYEIRPFVCCLILESLDWEKKIRPANMMQKYIFGRKK